MVKWQSFDGHPIEDLQINDVYLHQQGALSEALSTYAPGTKEDLYPEPGMFGKLPATGIWARNVRNIELSHVEVATAAPDNRPAIWLEKTMGADIFDLKAPSGPLVTLKGVSGFRSFGSRQLPDVRYNDLTSLTM